MRDPYDIEDRTDDRREREEIEADHWHDEKKDREVEEHFASLDEQRRAERFAILHPAPAKPTPTWLQRLRSFRAKADAEVTAARIAAQDSLFGML